MARTRHVFAALATLAAIGACGSDTAHAALLSPQVQTIVSVTAPPGCNTFVQDFSGVLRNALSSDSCTTNNLTGSGDARIDLNPLATGNRATVTSNGTVAVRDIGVGSFSTFLTHLNIGNAALDGEIGYVRYSFDINGSFDFQNLTPSTTAQGTYQFTARQNNGQFDAGFVGSEDTLRISNALDGTVIDIVVGAVADVDTAFNTILLPFRFGETFQLIVESFAGVFFDNVSGTNILADVDFFNTSTISQLLVFDANENPVADFTLASTGDLQFPGVPTGNGDDGGGDETGDVPAPGGLPLLAAGLLALGLRRRR